MGRKTIAIVIIVLGVLMLAGFVYIMFFDRLFFSGIIDKIKGDSGAETVIADPPDSATEQPAVSDPDTVRVIINPPAEPAPAGESAIADDPVDKTKENLKRMASSFAERYGSYSNQSNFSNIVDLKIFMSQAMQTRMDEYVRRQRIVRVADDLYFGITTKAVASEINMFDDHLGKAAVRVSARRREAINTISNVSDTFNQDITVNFIREKGAWKVDSANWLDK